MVDRFIFKSGRANIWLIYIYQIPIIINKRMNIRHIHKKYSCRCLLVPNSSGCTTWLETSCRLDICPLDVSLFVMSTIHWFIQWIFFFFSYFFIHYYIDSSFQVRQSSAGCRSFIHSIHHCSLIIISNIKLKINL